MINKILDDNGITTNTYGRSMPFIKYFNAKDKDKPNSFNDLKKMYKDNIIRRKHKRIQSSKLATNS